MNVTSEILASGRNHRSTSMLPWIPVERMTQQIDALPEDDWTGVCDRGERRRLQNRLNQRAYRKRKRNDGSTSPSDSGSTEQSTGDRISYPHFEDFERFCNMDPARRWGVIRRFEQWAYRNYMLRSPVTDHLLRLVQFNVMRALNSNTTTLGLTEQDLIDDDAISPFNAERPGAPTSVPPSLRPTMLQRSIPHHPWFDLLPIPNMRDNLLLAGDTFDDLQLCHDLAGFCNSKPERAGLIVWGEPWDPHGWEVTDAFLKNWGWTVKGCRELFESTNYWRVQRGEKPLFLIS